MLCKRGLCHHAVCVCVCLSRSYIVKTNKDIFEIFSPSVSHSSFSVPNGMAIFRREPPNGGVKCRWSRQKSRFWACICLHCELLTLRLARCCQYDDAGPQSRKLWHLSLVVSGGVDSRRRRRNVDDEKPQRYAKDNRTAHLIVRSDKSVAYITNKDSTRRFVLLKLTTDRHEAASLRQQSFLFCSRSQRIAHSLPTA